MADTLTPQISIPTRDLKGKKISPEILKYIPEESARNYRFVPIGVKDGVLEVGLVDPENMEARSAVSFIADKLGVPFKFYVVSADDFDRVIEDYKNISSEVSKALGELDSELSGEDTIAQSAKKPIEEKTELVEDAPITKIVAVILRHATDGNASDIHIEPTDDKLRVRFRVDGVLHTSLFLPMNVHNAIVARIKIICNMKLDEKRKPQDGRFSAPIDGRKIDFRVSSFPTSYGEKVVIRILDTDHGVKRLEELGYSADHVATLRAALGRPYGMILITGPTGSGKSTTLYAMLNELNREGNNVLSLEDPVEYNIPGVSQSQVRPEIGYTFANGLRSILRQDPDIIMVGEIRDKITARLAIQAALTGHLVLTTLHTNNAIGVIPRLIDMGIDPYLIAPTLIVAMAQRLVQQLCPDSKEKVELDPGMKAFVEREFSDLPAEDRKKLGSIESVYRPKPSGTCPGGTRGRIAVAEVLPIDKDLESMILRSPGENEIYEHARKRGFLTMRNDAIIKSAQGVVPFEEVHRV